MLPSEGWNDGKPQSDRKEQYGIFRGWLPNCQTVRVKKCNFEAGIGEPRSADDQALWKLDRFPDFLEAREELVRRGIKWLKGTTMPAAHDSLLERITIDSDVRFGKPCIRGHRITVQEILEWLSSGASQQQILADYPQLEPEDFLAVYAYAAELAAGRKASRG